MPRSAPPRPAARTVLVVGAGLAATALVTGLRTGGFTGAITVVGDDPPHDHPPLSKELFTADAPSDLRAQFSLAGDAATWLLGRRATAVVGGAVAVEDASGTLSTLTADAVVLALGARPTLPPDWAGVRTLGSWEDAQALRAALVPGSHLVIAGAGWIGLELASSAHAAGVRLTLVEETGRPLGHLVPPEVGDRIASWLGDVALVGGRAVGATATALELEGGRVVAGDVVVAALGARPATAWLPAEWLGPGGHVRTDPAGRVAPGIWAIGDCAGTQHWNAAVAAASRCASDILGLPAPAVPPPSVFSSMFGHHVDLVGRAAPGLEVLWREGDGWSALLLDGDELAGGVVVDRPRDVAALRRALARGATIDRAAAGDAQRPLAEALSRR